MTSILQWFKSLYQRLFCRKSTDDPIPEEAILGENLSKIHDKYYSGVSDKDFLLIIQADPTYSSKHPDKMGRYGKWLLSVYMKGNLMFEDLYKATEYLEIFHANKSRMGAGRDIMALRSLPDLFELINDYRSREHAQSKNEIVKAIKENEISREYEDEDWIIVIPKTRDAAIVYGKGTEWCTAATSFANYFDCYNSRGPLYICIDKKTHRKYQLHFESNTYCDEKDRQLDWPLAKTMGMTAAALSYFTSKGLWAIIGIDHMLPDSPLIVALADGQYLIGTDGNILSDGYDEMKVHARQWIIAKDKDGCYSLLASDGAVLIEKNKFPIEAFENNREFLTIHRGVNRREYYNLLLEQTLTEIIEANKLPTRIIADYLEVIQKVDAQYAADVEEDFYTIDDSVDFYRAYLRIYGMEAAHYRAARLHVIAPTIKNIWVTVAIAMIISAAILYNTGMQRIAIPMFALSALFIFAVLLIGYADKIGKTLQKIFAMALVFGPLAYFISEYGEKAILPTLIGEFVLMIGVFKLLAVFKRMLNKD